MPVQQFGMDPEYHGERTARQGVAGLCPLSFYQLRSLNQTGKGPNRCAEERTKSRREER